MFVVTNDERQNDIIVWPFWILLLRWWNEMSFHLCVEYFFFFFFFLLLRHAAMWFGPFSVEERKDSIFFSLFLVLLPCGRYNPNRVI